MTDYPPPPPGPQQPSHADAKAHAKAAKAYAKAQRPWYKKKRWIGLIAIVLIVIIAASSGGGSDPDSDDLKASDSNSDASSKDDGGDEGKDGTDTKDTEKDDDKAEEESDDPIGSKDNPAPRGKAVQNKSAKYQIDNVELKDSLGQFSDPPSGTYVVVTLTVENVKDETIQIGSGDFTLQVGGNEIDASDQALLLDNAFAFDDLSPGLKRTGLVAFDVSPKDAGKGVLKAQAQLSMDDAIYLKLTKK